MLCVLLPENERGEMVTVDGQISLADLLSNYRPAFCETWDEAIRQTLARPCMCCHVPGHYQRQLEAHIVAHGLTEGVYLNGDRVGDGHHRIVAAIRLGLEAVPLEALDECNARWVRDHGRVDWHERKFGDLLPHEYTAHGIAARDGG